MKRVQMAVVGVGHLGKEHARILAGLPHVELVGVADTSPEQARSVAERVGTQAFHDYWPLLNLVDAVSVVVPTSLHESVASEFLRRGIAVLVEKPMTPSLAAAERLLELAHKNNALLTVGHIERFNPAYEELRRTCIQPRYVRCERLGPFSGRSGDTGVVFDLMIHDLDLLLTLVDSEVQIVEALGVSAFGRHEDVANARLYFANGCVADVTASRAHPVASRQMHVWGPEGYAGLDLGQRRVTLIQPSATLRNHGLDATKLDPASRARIKDELFTRHMEARTIDGKAQDQLTAELSEFARAVESGGQSRVTGQHGRNAVALAERIVASLRDHPWTADAAGPRGPLHLPAPRGPLFTPAAQAEVA